MMPSLVELSKAMTPNKLKALRAAEGKLWSGGGHSSDRVMRDAAYAEDRLLARDPHYRSEIKRLKRNRAEFRREMDRPRRSYGSPQGVISPGRGSDTAFGDAHLRQTRKELERLQAVARGHKERSLALANDQRLKPRRLP